MEGPKPDPRATDKGDGNMAYYAATATATPSQAPSAASTTPAQASASLQGDTTQYAPIAKEWSKAGYVKLAPGVMQVEKRLGAPLYGLMNAYQHAFAKYGREPLGPRWKILVLEDSQGAWLGRIKYTRHVSTASSSSGALADWKCAVQIPAAHSEKRLEG